MPESIFRARPGAIVVLTGLLSAGGCRSRGTTTAPPAPLEHDADTAASEHTGEGRVLVANDGKLVGAIEGYAWVAGGGGTSFTTPNPCNERRCFRSSDGRLCAEGSIAPLACTGQGTSALSCDWDRNWGAKIGWDIRATHTAWGPSAPAQLSVAFTGDGAHYRLTAHRAGDSQEREYCIKDYVSGRAVAASDFVVSCWTQGGDALSDFAVVDKIGLQILSAEQPIGFHLCVDAIDVRSGLPSGTASAGAPGFGHARMIIDDDGTLDGALGGSAWAAGGPRTTIVSPAPCRGSACFTKTGGKLCALGTVRAESARPARRRGFVGGVDADDWDARIGLDTTGSGFPWGDAAPARLAVTYLGDAGRYRLGAHVGGDAADRVYCIEDYRSGQVIQATDLKTRCDGDRGDSLDGFASVDRLTLDVGLPPGRGSFDYCVTGLAAE